MKNSITRKIIMSYLLLIFSSLIFVGVFFNYAVERYFEKQIANKLDEGIQKIRDLLPMESTTVNDTLENKIRQSILEGMRVRRLATELEVEFAVVGRDMKVMFPRQSGEEAIRFKNQLLPQLELKLNNNKERILKLQGNKIDYMVAFSPLKSSDGSTTRGWIVLYAPVMAMKSLSKSMLLILSFSMMFIGTVAIIIGVFFARSIAKPIIELKKRAERLSKRDFDTKVEVRTGDELEELANTINNMAGELKEYDIAQKKFLQNASHELKTPLMSIQGYAEGIKDGVFEDNEHALDIIISESNRLKKIVEELIFLSKLETREDFYQTAPDSLHETLEKSIEKVNGIAMKNNININMMDFEDITLKMDRDKLTQALINILGNCLRYARSEINIAVIKNEKRAMIEISDDGEGFDTNDIKNVFTRFYKGKNGNTGLGMAITKIIIEKHGGSIEAKNGDNGGALFLISLPLYGF